MPDSTTTQRQFCLSPFPGEATGTGIRIAGSIGRREQSMTLRFELAGDLSDVAIPETAKVPARRDRLWEGTCLELFLGVAGSPRYWEFNLSPAGHWNVYRFASYRKDSREEPSFASLPFEVRRESGAVRLFLDFELGTIVSAGGELEVAVCAVVRSKTGDTSHWALTHSGSRPDFHRREDFRIRLPV